MLTVEEDRRYSGGKTEKQKSDSRVRDGGIVSSPSMPPPVTCPTSPSPPSLLSPITFFPSLPFPTLCLSFFILWMVLPSHTPVNDGGRQFYGGAERVVLPTTTLGLDGWMILPTYSTAIPPYCSAPALPTTIPHHLPFVASHSMPWRYFTAHGFYCCIPTCRPHPSSPSAYPLPPPPSQTLVGLFGG